MKAIRNMCLAILVSVAPSISHGTLFSDREGMQITDKTPKFMEEIGVSVSISKAQEKSLDVTFSLSDASYDTTSYVIDFFYVNSSSEIVLAIENPLPGSEHDVRFLISKGYKLVVAIMKNPDSGTEYYRVEFDNL